MFFFFAVNIEIQIKFADPDGHPMKQEVVVPSATVTGSFMKKLKHHHKPVGDWDCRHHAVLLFGYNKRSMSECQSAGALWSHILASSTYVQSELSVGLSCKDVKPPLVIYVSLCFIKCIEQTFLFFWPRDTLRTKLGFDWTLQCCWHWNCSPLSCGSVVRPADGSLWHLLHSLLSNVATTTALHPPKMLLVFWRGQPSH